MTDIDDSTILDWNEANDHADDGDPDLVVENEVPSLAVLVTREDGGETRIGPIPLKLTAEEMVCGFEGMRHNTTGAAGARFEIVDYDGRKEHLPLVGASMDSVLSAMYYEGARADGPFPDLWARLHAQHGYATALDPFNKACAYLDAEAAEATEEEQADKERAEVREQVAKAVQGYAELYAARTPGNLTHEGLTETVDTVMKLIPAGD